MNTINKSIVATLMLAMTIALAFGPAKTKNAGTDITASFHLPESMPGWNEQDVADEINIGEQKMDFSGPILAREFDKDQGPLLYLFILGADNFHRPKACVGGAGFTARDLDDITFKIPHHSWKAKAIYFQKEDEGFLTVYWISINKKEVDWTGQKLTPWWYSQNNKQKAGVMVRIDITATSDQLDQAGQTIQELLGDLSAQIPPEEQDYLFGK